MELRKQVMLIVGEEHFLSVVTTRKQRIRAQHLKSQKLKQGDCEAEYRIRGEKGKKKKLDCISYFADFAELGTYPKMKSYWRLLDRRMTGSKNTSKGSP